jgi:hypothetical protein
MRCNEAWWDRGLRLLIGSVLVSLALFGPKTPWGWIGLLQLSTGLSGYCVLYEPLGWNTRARSKHLAARKARTS